MVTNCEQRLLDSTSFDTVSLLEVVGYYSNQRLLIVGQEPLDPTNFYKSHNGYLLDGIVSNYY
jgi:hypothetical protein